MQVYDLYDVPVFKILRDENVAEGRTASDGSWKPHALEKTPGAMYVGNNSRNLTVGGVAVPAEAPQGLRCIMKICCKQAAAGAWPLQSPPAAHRPVTQAL